MNNDLKRMLVAFINTLATELRKHVQHENIGKPARAVLDMLPAISDEIFERIEDGFEGE